MFTPPRKWTRRTLLRRASSDCRGAHADHQDARREEACLFDPNAVSAARYTLYRQNEPRIRR
jgi:hypothetical protein